MYVYECIVYLWGFWNLFLDIQYSVWYHFKMRYNNTDNPLIVTIYLYGGYKTMVGWQ